MHAIRKEDTIISLGTIFFAKRVQEPTACNERSARMRVIYCLELRVNFFERVHLCQKIMAAVIFCETCNYVLKAGLSFRT